MKKLLGVSLVAMLVASPLVARADGEPMAASVPAAAISETPVSDIASTSYVAGAYNAAIGVANKVDADAKAREGALDSLTTTAKTSLVAAINEVAGAAGDAQTAAQVQTAITNAAGTTANTSLAGSNGVLTVQVDTNHITRDNSGNLTLSAADVASLGKADTAVQSVTASTEQMANGTINVDGNAVAVKGLGSAAYTASTAYDAAGAASDAETAAKSYADGLASNYATAAQGGKADSAVQTVKVNSTALTEDENHDVNLTIAEGATNGTIAVNSVDVAVHGLGSAAYTASTAYDAAGAAATAESNAKSYTDAKTVTVHTTWGTYATTGTVQLNATTPAS